MVSLLHSCLFNGSSLGVTTCLLLPMWGICHFCCLCWCCALNEPSGLLCSQHPDLKDGIYPGSLLGSAASEPLHLQGVVLLWHVLLCCCYCSVTAVSVRLS